MRETVARMEEVESIKSPVREFFHDKTVFITGATGFMGKVLVEKLLRSTDVSKICILIRPKKGVQTAERLKVLLNSSVFNRLRESKPEKLELVECIDGDITEEGLGIEPDMERRLAEEVQVVFHCAATVRFDEDLSKSVSMNVGGVVRVLALAKQMKRLEAMVDISTAYANCDKPHIEEKIYPTAGDARGLLDLCQWMDSKILDSREVTQKLIGDYPNTYCYTKALAEQILETEGSDLPITIFRPSIVSAALREPVPGWVDNFNGPSGVIAGAGKGVLRTLYCRRDCVADIVPVDLCINIACCLAWKTATSFSDEHSLKVYNFTSGGTNPVTWGKMEWMGLISLEKTPFEGMLWYPGGSYKENWHMNRLYQLLYHYGPFHAVDFLCRAVGKKPFLVKISNMMQKSSKALEPFTTNSWTWSNENVKRLAEELTEDDKKIFGFDLRDIQWQDYLNKYVEGIREFLFKEDPATLPTSRKNLKIMYWLDIMVQVLFLLGSLYLLSKMFF